MNESGGQSTATSGPCNESPEVPVGQADLGFVAEGGGRARESNALAQLKADDHG
jgi:hypothetical protein